VEQCTALRVPGEAGIGAVVGRFVREAAREAGTLEEPAFTELAESSLDLFTLAYAAVRPQDFTLSRSRSLSLSRVKAFVARHLAEPALDTAMVVCGTGLSARYINDLFQDADSALMRYVWQQRLERCRRDLRDPLQRGRSISEIAYGWGFGDLAHFSRAFRRRYGISPREFRREGSSAAG
jgi:AraC-like DNA-binding protein